MGYENDQGFGNRRMGIDKFEKASTQQRNNHQSIETILRGGENICNLDLTWGIDNQNY